MIKALFLDRDGVINIDKGYVHKAEDCVFVDGIFELVKKANSLDYRVVIVTNQAGIARGYYSETQFLEFTDWMLAKFNENHAVVDHVYFCPHHPKNGIGQYAMDCDCRKPKPGMLLKAAQELNLELKSSIMVGDNLSDFAAADAAGLSRFYLLSNQDELLSQPLHTQFERIVSLDNVAL